MNFLARLWTHFRARPLVFPALVAGFSALGLFGEVVDDVLEGDSHALDRQILLALRDPDNPQSPFGPPWLEEMMRDFTGLGGIGILMLVTMAAVMYLWIIQRRSHAIYLAAVAITGTILSNAMKIGFDRPRPDLVPHGSITAMASFPSGHSLMATVIYLSLGAILARSEPRQSMRVYILSIAIFIAGLVGISRLYLGVHWPSDILAGWLVGAGWALLFWVLAQYLEEHHILRKARNQ